VEQVASLAEYVQFNVYLPVRYQLVRRDAEGHVVKEPRATREDTIEEFLLACREEFGGVTRVSPPLGSAPFVGYWRESSTAEFEIDHLTLVFVLVRLGEVRKAVAFFETWKKLLGSETHQKVILVTYHPVQTVGEVM
jgi:hypothetical protein